LARFRRRELHAGPSAARRGGPTERLSTRLPERRGLGADPSVPRGERASLRDPSEGAAHRGRGATAPAHGVPKGEGRGPEGARAHGPVSPALAGPEHPRGVPKGKMSVCMRFYIQMFIWM